MSQSLLCCVNCPESMEFVSAHRPPLGYTESCIKIQTESHNLLEEGGEKNDLALWEGLGTKQHGPEA